MKKPVPVVETLNLFPEVTWDRWTGDVSKLVSVFGWIPQEGSGRSDFVLIKIDKKGALAINTSSPKYSTIFCERLGFDGHADCKRVEHDFPGVIAVHLKITSDPDHGPIQEGHICKHGVRWPHECKPCADDAWANRSDKNL